MDIFLNWLNHNENLDLVLKTTIAHFRFIIIHPFDNGNGRIARAITNLLLSRADKSNYRFYSVSSQILVQKKEYYEVLKKVQPSTGDITEWIVSFFWLFEKCLTSN